MCNVSLLILNRTLPEFGINLKIINNFLNNWLNKNMTVIFCYATVPWENFWSLCCFALPLIHNLPNCHSSLIEKTWCVNRQASNTKQQYNVFVNSKCLLVILGKVLNLSWLLGGTNRTLAGTEVHGETNSKLYWDWAFS